MLALIKQAGFGAFIVKVGGLYKVQLGAFKTKANADALCIKVEASGFDAFVTTARSVQVSAFEATADKISAGDTVMVRKGARTYTGAWLASFVYDRKHKVLELKGDRAVIAYQGVIVAAVKLADLVKA
jgi:hypothetical protein